MNAAGFCPFVLDSNQYVNTHIYPEDGTQITSKTPFSFRNTRKPSNPKLRHLCHLQEGGSRLAALRCLTQSCQGSMFPEEPLEENTKWQCEECGHQVTGRQASLTQAMLGRLLSIVDNRNVLQMERFLSQHQHIMPSSNQIVIEVKCDLIRSYGHAKGYSWAGEYTA